MASPLDILADVAIHRASSPACYESYEFDHSPPHSPFPSSSSTSSEYLPKPLKRSNAAAGACGARQLRPRRKAHKSHKSSRLHIKPKPELKLRRKELMERACAIKSLENSPVNEQQLFVLRTVYDEITMYPTEPWLVLMAVVLHRSLRQIKNWFSNTRQKNRCGDAAAVCMRTDAGERLRLRPAAAMPCGSEWSDAFFEEVLMILNYRTARRLQWERAQAMDKFTLTNLNDFTTIL